MAEVRILGRPRSVWRSTKDFLATHTVSSTGGLLFLLLVFFLLWPIIAMLAGSISNPQGFTLQYYREFLSHDYYYRSFLNSLALGAVVTPVCLGISFCIAYMTTRGPVHFRKPLRLITFLPLIAPSCLFALSFIMLLGRRGVITQALNLNWDIYGFIGCVVVQTLSTLPLGYMLIENTLSSLNPNLEDSAANLGATEGKILRSITIPLLHSGLLKAALIVFVWTVSAFGNLALLQGRTPFLAPDAYSLIMGEADFNMASVLSVFLVLPCAFLFVAQNYLAKRKGYTTIVGKPVTAEPRHIVPVILIPMLTISLIACGLILLSFAIIGVGAFTKIVGVDNTFTLKWILDFGSNTAFVNSLKISFLSGLFGAILGVLLAYVIIRGKFKGRDTLEVGALAGFTLPGTVLGIGYLMAFNKPPLLLTGTMVILVINCVFRHLAIGMEAGISKLQQLSIEVEEASLNLGASTATTFRRIVLPIIFPAFVYGFMYVFMLTMIGISAVIFLMSPGYPLAAIVIFHSAMCGNTGLASATTLKLIMAVGASFAILQYLSKWTRLSVVRKE